MDELLARLRAALRRATPGDGGSRRRDRRLHRRPRRQAGRHARRRRGAPHPDRVADRRGARPQPGQARHASASCCRRCGARSTGRRPTTCASTWPRSGASSSPTRRGRATSSPSPAWATASSATGPRTCLRLLELSVQRVRHSTSGAATQVGSGASYNPAASVYVMSRIEPCSSPRRWRKTTPASRASLLAST